MPSINETKAEEIAKDHIRKMITFRMEKVVDTSGLSCSDSDNFSDYHVFWFSVGRTFRLKSESYIAVNKNDGTIVRFEYGE